ncbi:TPA: hypothetical protein RJN57_000491 [Pseudomonas aeruginosa]|jgi:hypothetical protein|nr:hypothetical protein PSA83_06527 [Pseudomonas aeruginosa]MCO3748010.1 hypothetical protein [Pseudomonas aeruginosa]HDV6122987.1 hypothetical protein [Pseudomonas aeruginosa]HDV6143865.1 hypothetical protein [Pseudomonas aeruginosa]HDV6168487.1 hypothetical protein [Pseudomonas aeruginosa]
MRIIHRGVELNQAQLDAIVPVLNDSMRGLIRGKKKLEAAIDKALEEAGCPLENPVVTLR